MVSCVEGCAVLSGCVCVVLRLSNSRTALSAGTAAAHSTRTAAGDRGAISLVS